MIKTQLEIGDKIQRFEVSLTREVDAIYVITSVTKTLAKCQNKTFKRMLDFDAKKPIKSKNKIIAKVYINEKTSWSSPDYFLVKTN